MNTILIATAVYFCSMPFLLIWSACADAKVSERTRLIELQKTNSVPPQIDFWN